MSNVLNPEDYVGVLNGDAQTSRETQFFVVTLSVRLEKGMPDSKTDHNPGTRTLKWRTY
jgi:hypothetical protein